MASPVIHHSYSDQKRDPCTNQISVTTMHSQLMFPASDALLILQLDDSPIIQCSRQFDDSSVTLVIQKLKYNAHQQLWSISVLQLVTPAAQASWFMYFSLKLVRVRTRQFRISSLHREPLHHVQVAVYPVRSSFFRVTISFHPVRESIHHQCWILYAIELQNPHSAIYRSDRPINLSDTIEKTWNRSGTNHAIVQWWSCVHRKNWFNYMCTVLREKKKILMYSMYGISSTAVLLQRVWYDCQVSWRYNLCQLVPTCAEGERKRERTRSWAALDSASCKHMCEVRRLALLVPLLWQCCPQYNLTSPLAESSMFEKYCNRRAGILCS